MHNLTTHTVARTLELMHADSVHFFLNSAGDSVQVQIDEI